MYRTFPKDSTAICLKALKYQFTFVYSFTLHSFYTANLKITSYPPT